MKSTSKAHTGHTSSLAALCREVRVKHPLVVTLEPMPRKLSGGIQVLPWRTFIERLWAGDFV